MDALSAGADANARLEGHTPALHLAVRFGTAAMVEALLRAGADPMIAYGGHSALDAAHAMREACANEVYEGSAERVREAERIIEVLTPGAADPFSMDSLRPEDLVPIEPAGEAQIEREAAEFVWQILEGAFGAEPFTTEQALAQGLGEERIARSLPVLESHGVVAQDGAGRFVFCVPFPEDESVSPFDALEMVPATSAAPPADDPVEKAWAAIWNAFGAREFSFDELTDLGFSSDDANTALTFLKEMGVTETVGLRRFACRKPFGATPEDVPEVAPPPSMVDSTSSVSDILDHETFDSRFTSRGVGVMRVKVALMSADDINQRFAADHRDQRLRGSTLMHLAVQYCNTTIMEQLIEQGADLELENHAGLGARQLAANFHENYSTRDADVAAEYAELLRVMQPAPVAPANEPEPPKKEKAQRTPKTVTKAERQRRKELIEERQRLEEQAKRPWWKLW